MMLFFLLLAMSTGGPDLPIINGPIWPPLCVFGPACPIDNAPLPRPQ
jgi:hypothetical protein